MDQVKPLILQVQEAGDIGRQIIEFRDIGAEVLGRAELDIAPYIVNEPDRLFISSAALSRSEYGRALMAKVVRLIEQAPDDPDRQSLAAMIFRQTAPSEVSGLASPIIAGTNAELNSPEHQKKNDLSLMYGYLRSIDQPQLAAMPPLDAQQFMKADAHLYSSLVPDSEREKVRVEFPAQVLLSTSLGPLKEYAPHLITQALDLLPELLKVNPSLAYLTAMKLFLEGDEKSASMPFVRELVKKTIEQSEQEPRTGTERQLQSASHAYLATAAESESTHLPESAGFARQLLHHGLAAEAGQLADIQTRAPHLLRQEPLLTLLSPVDATRLLSFIPLEQVPTLMATPLASIVAAGTSAAVLQGARLDPETAAKYVLMTPEAAMSSVPWDMIKQVLEFLVKMDHKHPLYAELSHRLEPLTSREVKAEAKVLEKPVATALTAVAAADFSALKSIDAPTVKQALEEARVRQDLQPELAAKLFRLLSLDQLAEAPVSLREGTTEYLSTRKHYTVDDAETAARLVAATPRNMLQSLNENILTLAATIAQSNVSFADRDQLQSVITRELQELISPHDPLSDDDET